MERRIRRCVVIGAYSESHFDGPPGDVTFGAGGAFDFEINDFAGVAGSGTLGWDLLNADSIDITATSGDQFVINASSLTAAQAAGDALNFDPNNSYSLMFASTTGGITGFSADRFSVDTSGFQNSFLGSWGITMSGNDMFLNFTAVPEPSSFFLFAFCGCAAAIRTRRRRA